MLMRTESTITGASIRCNEIPADFIARSSLCSPRPPSVIIDARSDAKGIERGSNVQAPHPRNSIMTPNPRPLPTSSSIYLHRNWSERANVTTKRIAKNGPKNETIRCLSSFFICYPAIFSSSFALASGIPAAFFPPAVARPG